MLSKKSFRSFAAVGVAAALALSACSSSSDKSSGGSAGSGGSSAAAGSGSSAKATVLVIGDLTAAPTLPFSLPEIVPMVKGVLKNNKNVTVETCDSKGTPAAWLVCEQKAVTDKVAVAVLGFSAGATDQSVLTKANIPVVGNAKADSPNGYPTAESFSLYVALGAGLYATGCRKLGIIYIDGSDFLIKYIKDGFEGKGGKEVARGAVAANAADLTPAVSKVTSAGAECVAVSLAPTGAAQALTALKQSGKNLIIGGISAVFSQQLIDSLKTLTEGLIVVDTALNPGDDAPGINEAKAAMTGEDSGAKMTQQAVGAFISAKLINAALAKASGDVTAESMTTALNGLKDVDVSGVIHPWSTTTLQSKTFARIFNHYGINYKIVGGKPVKQGDFYDTASILANE